MSVTLKKITVRQIVIIGLMAALCLVSNYFSFPVPIGIDKSRIHLGNVFCILSAFMLGPVGGGLAAGIGAFFYDIFTGYGAECIITFINKFLMAFVCGWLLNLMTRAKKLPQLQLILRRIIASVAGCLTYVVLYMTKSYITLYLESNIGEAVDRSATIWATVIGKGYVSLVNGLIAVVVANLIYSSIAAALKKQHLSIS